MNTLKRSLSLAAISFFWVFSSSAQTVDAVRNAASIGTALAPGTWVAIFGSQLAPSTALAQSAPFPTQLNRVSVTFAGVAAPMNYVSANQINALIPFEAATLSATDQTSVPVVVTTPAGVSPAFTVQLVRNAPAIYTKNSSGSGLALAFDGDFRQIDTLGTTPIVLYATGLGPTNPSAPTNALGASTEPLNRVADSISVSIGGSPATVLYAGLAPNLHAVYQLNILPPSTGALGNSLAISSGLYGSANSTLPVVAGTNVANVSASLDGLYPASGVYTQGGKATLGPIGFSAILNAGIVDAAFDIRPDAEPFQVVVLMNGSRAATIAIDPVQKTWNATYSVPTIKARAYDFSAISAPVFDYSTCLGTTCTPFPGNIVPLSRTDPVAFFALQKMPLPNTSTSSDPVNTTWSAQGALPAAGHFSMQDLGLNQGIGAFTLANRHSPGTFNMTLSVYVDNQLIASKAVPYLVQ